MRSTFMAVLAALAAACCHQGKASDALPEAPSGPATVTPESVDALKAALAAALQRGGVELGADDPTQAPVVSVLPRPTHPLNDRDPLKPTVFDLVLENGACLAIRRDTGERVALDGVECRVVGE